MTSLVFRMFLLVPSLSNSEWSYLYPRNFQSSLEFYFVLCLPLYSLNLSKYTVRFHTPEDLQRCLPPLRMCRMTERRKIHVFCMVPKSIIFRCVFNFWRKVLFLQNSYLNFIIKFAKILNSYFPLIFSCGVWLGNVNNVDKRVQSSSDSPVNWMEHILLYKYTDW